MIWPILTLMGVPLWLCAVGVLAFAFGLTAPDDFLADFSSQREHEREERAVSCLSATIACLVPRLNLATVRTAPDAALSTHA